jgi:hypothetical protein
VRFVSTFRVLLGLCIYEIPGERVGRIQSNFSIPFHITNEITSPTPTTQNSNYQPTKSTKPTKPLTYTQLMPGHDTEELKKDNMMSTKILKKIPTNRIETKMKNFFNRNSFNLMSWIFALLSGKNISDSLCNNCG